MKLTRLVVLLFALIAGSSAGCLYYLQPLLHEVAGELRVSTATAGVQVVATRNCSAVGGRRPSVLSAK